MLVCGSMKDIIGSVPFKEQAHVVLICYACNNSFRTNIRILKLHCKTNIVHWCFGLVYQYHLFRFETCNLIYHFKANRTCSSCYHYHLISQLSANFLHVHLNLLSWQQVFNLHFSEMFGTILALAVPLFGRRHHKYLNSCINQSSYQILTSSEIIYLVSRDNQHGGIGILHVLNKVRTVLSHLYSQKIFRIQISSWRNKSHQGILLWSLVLNALCDRHSTGANSINKSVLSVVVFSQNVKHSFYKQPLKPHQQG